MDSLGNGFGNARTPRARSHIGNGPVFSLRNLTSCLAVAALLLGNVAGWVHVGCQDPAGSGCGLVDACGARGIAVNVCGHETSSCSDHSHGHGARSAASAERQHCDEGEGEGGEEHEDGEEYEDGHEDGHGHEGEQEHEYGEEHECGEKGRDEPGRGHDSDRCSVCQNLFVSRHALPAIAAAVCPDAPASSFRQPIIDVLFVPSVPHTNLSVRGPPRV